MENWQIQEKTQSERELPPPLMHNLIKISKMDHIRHPPACIGGKVKPPLHPASSLYSTVTILRSDAPLNLRAFFEPYVSFFWVGIIQGGLKSSLRFSGGLKKSPKKFRGA